MALTKTPVCDFGKKAEDFKLKSINNKVVTLKDIKGKKDTFYYTVCTNAAFGILINQSEDFNEKNILKAFNEVQLIIGSGEPLRIIEQLSKFTNL